MVAGCRRARCRALSLLFAPDLKGNQAVREAIAGTLLLFSTSAIAGTYVPVHVAPIHVAPLHVAPVHVAPVVRGAPVVRVNPVVRAHSPIAPVHSNGRTGSHQKLPVMVYTVPQ